MKMHTWLLATLLATGTAFAGSEVAPPPPDMSGASAAEPPAVTLPRDKGRFWAFSYTMGRTLGARMHSDIAELDLAAFQEGLREVFANQPSQLDEAQMSLAMSEFNAWRQAQAQAAFDKLAAENLEKAQKYLADNGKRKGVKTTKSGLQYEVLEKAGGPSPTLTDVVVAHYHGTLIDGTVFDSSREGEPVEFPLARVIPGWKEGLQLMQKGARYRLHVPPALAYGARGVDEAIGPNQVLVFEVTLIDFHPQPTDVPVQDEHPF